MGSKPDSKSNGNDGDRQALTIKGLCERLQIHETTYYRHRDELPAPLRIGNALRFPIATVEAWEVQQVRREQIRRLDSAN